MSLNTLFAGVTPSPEREFVARLARDGAYERVILPCAGRFGVAEAVVRAGVPAERVWASDITLFSSIVGVLADPRRTLDELAIRLDPSIQLFVAGAADAWEYAGGVMLAIKYTQVPPNHQQLMNIRAELRTRREHYRRHLAGQLEALAERMRGLHYRAADLWDEVEPAKDDPRSFAHLSPPWYKAGYSHMFAVADKLIAWNHPELREWDPGEFPKLFARLADYRCHVAVDVTRDLAVVPDGWTPVFAQSVGDGRADYLVTNYQPRALHAELKLRSPRIKRYPIYDDHALTPASEVRVVPADPDTAIYYRNLFVHRLPPTKSGDCFLVLLDGQVASAVGLNDQHLLLGNRPYVNETFGVTIASERYPRLAKLKTLALTSGDMKRLLMQRQAYLFREPAGLRTTTKTAHEDKAVAGIMREAAREPLKGGGYRLVYQADFRADSWADCLQTWLTRWAAPEQEPPKRKKKRAMVDKGWSPPAPQPQETGQAHG